MEAFFTPKLCIQSFVSVSRYVIHTHIQCGKQVQCVVSLFNQIVHTSFPSSGGPLLCEVILLDPVYHPAVLEAPGLCHHQKLFCSLDTNQVAPWWLSSCSVRKLRPRLPGIPFQRCLLYSILFQGTFLCTVLFQGCALLFQDAQCCLHAWAGLLLPFGLPSFSGCCRICRDITHSGLEFPSLGRDSNHGLPISTKIALFQGGFAAYSCLEGLALFLAVAFFKTSLLLPEVLPSLFKEPLLHPPACGPQRLVSNKHLPQLGLFLGGLVPCVF